MGKFSVVENYLMCTDGQTTILMGITRGYEQH